ncbi:MAG TPA: N-acetylneuraminate synthase [Candidatus Omnitrophota bacterium]|nr:N-acetylneuraminate synthase [Candidatus Omnitrophota bacterium]
MRRERAYIIAEAGVNHNGSLRLAKRLVDVAKYAGADAVKFQSFHAEEIATANVPKANYQSKNLSGGCGQLEMLKKLELSVAKQRALFFYCRKKKIEFLSTPFDLKSLAFLIKLGVKRLKISSGELTNGPLLLAAARSGLPLILSTGMSDLAEIRDALDVIAFGYLRTGNARPPHSLKMRRLARTTCAKLKLAKNVTLLQCTSEYPTPMEDINLRAMDALREKFGVSAGLSDHSTGIAVPIAAAARGARIIEKHFTLDRNSPGPDHQASLEPDELKLMVKAIREIERALGDGHKRPARSESKNMAVVRRSIVAARTIAAGEEFSELNLTVKRAGKGISPMLIWSFYGKRASRCFSKDERVTL